MKIQNALLRLAFLVLSITTANSQSLEQIDPNYNSSEVNHLKQIQQSVWQGIPKDKQKGWKYLARWEYFWAQRLFPDMKMGNAAQAYNQLQKNTTLKNNKNNTLQSVNWSLLGPTSAPSDFNGSRSQGLGRVNVIRFHPLNPQEFWIGSATGGVWKTTNKGKNWINFPYTQFMSLGVSDIAFSNSTPSTVYVATGDVDGTVGSGDTYYSVGIIKTTDGGTSWITTNLAFELSESASISRLLVDPNNPDIVITTTNRGIYKTTDGGVSWNVVLSGNYRDMEQKPDDFNVLYVVSSSFGGDNKLLKSTNAGQTWVTVQELKGVIRTAITVSKANVNNVYAICGSYNTNGYHSFYISDDQGSTFSVISEVASSPNILGWYEGIDTDYKGQSAYDLCLAVSPINDSKVFIGGINVWKSANYGASWIKNTVWYDDNSLPFIHADQHDLAYNPLTNELFAVNDGGVYYTTNDGNTWTDISDGLSIMQFYRMSQSITNPNLVIAGAQDNGSNMFTSTGWKKTLFR